MGKMVEVFREVKRVLRRRRGAVFEFGGLVCLNSLQAAKASVIQAGLHGAQGNTKYRQTLRTICEAQYTGIRSSPGLKPKDLCGIPWRVALALQADGWWLRSDIIWAKPKPDAGVLHRPAHDGA